MKLCGRSSTQPLHFPRLKKKVSPWNGQTIFIALVILGIISLGACGIGVASFGGQYGIWSVGSLSHLGQIHAIIMMTAGSGSGLFFLTTGVTGSVKKYIDQLKKEHTRQIRIVEKEKRQLAQENSDVPRALKKIKQKSKEKEERAALLKNRDIAQEEEIQGSGDENGDVAKAQEEEIQASENEIGDVANVQQQQTQEAEKLARRILKGKMKIGTKQDALNVEEEMSSTKPISNDKAPHPNEKVFKAFSNEPIFQQKYQVVLEQYQKISLSEIRPVVEQGLLNDYANKKMYDHLNNMLKILSEHKDVDEARNEYQTLIRELRAVINSTEYKGLVEATEPGKTIISFVHEFCLLRWQGTHLYTYLKEIVELTAGHIPPLDLETFSDTVLEVNNKVKHSSVNKKFPLALGKQKLTGALGLEDFNGNSNIPHVRHVQVYENEDGKEHSITYPRHGSPTALGNYSYWEVFARKVLGVASRGVFGTNLVNTGEEITPDFEEYLRALGKHQKSELYIVLQRQTPNLIEDESARVAQIKSLQNKHDNFHVLVQPVEGDLFEHKGDFAKCSTFEELKQSLIDTFFPSKDIPENKRAAALPDFFLDKPEYKKVFIDLLDKVHEIFFPEEEVALDLSKRDSIDDLEQQLEKERHKEIRKVKEKLHELDLSSLKYGVDPSFESSIYAEISEDKELMASIKDKINDSIQTHEDLKNWLPNELVDTTQPIETLLNEKNMPIITYNIISSIANKIKANEKIEKLEEEKAAFLAKWQSFILLFYTFQEMDLKFRLNGVKGYELSVVVAVCKEDLDRGGNKAFVTTRLIHYMLGEEGKPERMEEALFTLAGPTIAVKKIAVILKRLLPGLEVEKLLKNMTPEARKKLSEFRFGDEKWRIKRIETSKLMSQTGIPLIGRAIQKEIEKIAPEVNIENPEEVSNEVVKAFNRFAGIEWKQWIPFTANEKPKTYNEIKELLKAQIESSLNSSLDNAIGLFTFRSGESESFSTIKRKGGRKKAIYSNTYYLYAIGGQMPVAELKGKAIFTNNSNLKGYVSWTILPN